MASQARAQLLSKAWQVLWRSSIFPAALAISRLDQMLTTGNAPLGGRWSPCLT